MARITKAVEERRQEIIDIAREFFIENGFDKTQMADISKKMGVAQGLVYHYFKSKTEIYYAVIDSIVEEKMQIAKRVLSGMEGSALDKIKALSASHQPFDDNEELITRLVSDPAIIEYSKRKMSTSFIPLLLSLIEQGNADGSFNCKYPKETAMFILQGMTGIATELSSYPQEKENIITASTDIIFRVLGIVPPSS